MNFLRYAFAVGVLFVSTQASAAQCVNITLRDQNGIALKSDAPTVGFILPGVGPILNQTIPAQTSVEPGLPADCPADLIAAIQGLFNEACLSDATRKATAEANGQKIDVINERCKALYGVLNSTKK